MKENLYEQLYGDLDAVKVSDGSVLHCKKVSDREDSPFDPIDALNLKVKGCSEQLIMNCRSIVQESSETSFMYKHLVPYLNEIFLKDPFKYSVYGMSTAWSRMEISQTGNWDMPNTRISPSTPFS